MANTTTTTTRKSCPITRQGFRDHGNKATPTVTIAGQPVAAMAKEFATGSVGYFANGKVQLMIGGVPVMCQVGLNITVIGSKDLPATTIRETVQAAHAEEALAQQLADALAKQELAVA